MIDQPKIYPFKFLDAYEAKDKDIFFGRTEEIESLYKMVFLTNILLVYGASGTGKTSLIQCGLANKFQDYDWLALYIRRGKNIISSLDKLLCQKSGGSFVYQEKEEGTLTELTHKFEAVYLNSFRPIYLIFDQFEELYILGSKQEQAQFVETIKEVLKVEQPVKIIISIREEYLGELYEFEKAIPELMRKKLRVEAMNSDKVKSIIKGIGNFSQSNVSLQKGEENEIAQGIFDKVKGIEKTLTIPLPYLQVFLDKLYLKCTHDESRQSEAVFSMEVLNEMGNLGNVLSDFLEEQVSKIAKELFPQEEKEKAEEIIWKILSSLVTLEGTKEPMSFEDLAISLKEIDEKKLKEVLTAFENSRIARQNENNGVYEIMHDFLAKPIQAKRSKEDIAILEIKRLIKSQTDLYEAEREFFSEKQLQRIEPYLGKFPLQEKDKEWIAKSKEHWQVQKDEEARRHQEEINKAKATAEKEKKLREEAEKQKNIAELARVEAERQRNIAEEALNVVETEKQKAEEQRLIALNNAKKAEEQGLIALNNAKKEEEQRIVAEKAQLSAKRRSWVAIGVAVVAIMASIMAFFQYLQAEQLRIIAFQKTEAALRSDSLAQLRAKEAILSDSISQIEKENALNAEHIAIIERQKANSLAKVTIIEKEKAIAAERIAAQQKERAEKALKQNREKQKENVAKELLLYGNNYKDLGKMEKAKATYQMALDSLKGYEHTAIYKEILTKLKQ